ncbi:uncharacterized protein LOC116424549 isoform X2 [Nomia melanderi]
MSKLKSVDRKICCFCGLPDDDELQFGKFYEYGDIVTHYYCLLLSSNMEQKGGDNDGILGFLKTDIQKEIRRGKRLVCSHCKKGGATLGCCNIKCKKMFHYPCGLRAGSLNQFFGEFRSYCQIHRPRQKIDLKVKSELEKTTDIKCYICYDDVNPADRIDTIWAPCCKKNTWFHRKCVQQLAMSAGYFFKCPLCNNKRKFQKEMLEFGIFIPRQDASWELEPNAFQELLYRHDQCDAPICLCPKGRKYTSFNAKWELALCRTCGSQGIHMACGQLKWSNPVWECSECISILDKSKENINTNTSLSTLQRNDSDSEESDSDISVGTELPCTTDITIPVLTQEIRAINVRPGPRSFKLRQYEIAKEMEQSHKSNNRQQCIEETHTALNITKVEEYANNKNTPISKSNSPKEQLNSVTEHCKSTTVTSDDSIITLDSHDEMNASISSLENTILIVDVNEPVQNDLCPLNNNNVKDKSDDTVQTVSASRKEKLRTDSSEQNHDSNTLINNLRDLKVKTGKLEENNSQDLKSVDLDRTILNIETDSNSSDSLSNIRISNVISLTPDQFENVSFVDDKQKINNAQCLQQNSSSRPHSSRSKSDNFEMRLKRKIDNAVSNSISALEEKSKKRKNFNAYKQQDQSLPVSVDIENISESKKIADNISIPTLDADRTQINKSNNSNTFATMFKTHKKYQSHVQVEQRLVRNTDVLFDTQTPNVNHTEENILKILDDDDEDDDDEDGDNDDEDDDDDDDDISVSSKCKRRSNSNSETNSEMEISENKNIEGDIKNCDADAGTRRAATSSRYRHFPTDEGTDLAKGYFRHSFLPSGTSEQKKSQNDIEMATMSNHGTNVSDFKKKENKNTESDNYRLIPEYIRLCDLKFRVCNSNNLLMVLYNKFSVNINMENSVIMKNNAGFDSTWKNIQQKYLRTHSEITSIFKPGDSLQSSTPICKDNGKHDLFINGQSESYCEDAKENLDPICCKITADNGNNQSENSSLTHYKMYNTSKVIEEDSKWRYRENVNLVNDSANTFDTDEFITHSNDKHFKNINNVKQKNTNTEGFGKNDIFDLTESHCVNNKVKNKRSVSGIHFKISIDLKKIESLIDTNLELFSKDRKKNDEQNIDDIGLLKVWNDLNERINITNRHVSGSVIDESKHLGNFTLSTVGGRVAELKSHRSEDNERNDIKNDSDISRQYKKRDKIFQ